MFRHSVLLMVTVAMLGFVLDASAGDRVRQRLQTPDQTCQQDQIQQHDQSCQQDGSCLDCPQAGIQQQDRDCLHWEDPDEQDCGWFLWQWGLGW